MASSCQTICENCREEIASTSICDICDPKILGLVVGRKNRKSPHLCRECFKAHKKTHEKPSEKVLTYSCQTCGHPEVPLFRNCPDCGCSTRL